jgi:hypothetical protein
MEGRTAPPNASDKPLALSREQVVAALQETESKAWDGLSRFQFWIFGYYAARWAHLAALWREATGEVFPNPYVDCVKVARERFCRDCRTVVQQPHRCRGGRPVPA